MSNMTIGDPAWLRLTPETALELAFPSATRTTSGRSGTKRLSTDYSTSERAALFHETATRVYRIENRES